MKLKTLPVVSIDYKANHSWANIIFFSNINVGRILGQFSYVFDVVLFEFRHAMFTTFGLTTFFDFIFHVLFLSPYKQMFGINTSHVVTMMTDKVSFWDRSNMYEIRKSMRPHCVSWMRTNMKNAIEFFSISFPYPTSLSLSYKFKESFNRVFWFVHKQSCTMKNGDISICD